jgi:excisionase family DNA binding protein
MKNLLVQKPNLLTPGAIHPLSRREFVQARPGSTLAERASVPGLLTLEHTARYLGIGSSKLTQLIRSHRLKVVRLGYRTVRVRQSDLDDFVARNAR